MEHRADYSHPERPTAVSGAGEDLAEDAAPGMRVDARAGAGQRLDRFLASCLSDVSRTRLQRWIELGAVTVDGQLVLPRHKLRGIEIIDVVPLPTEAERAFEPDAMDLHVVHEDADLMIVDKPAGRVVHPAPGNWRGTLMNGLLHARPDSARLPRAGIVHRLDKDTSGLMMVARSERGFDRLVAALAARTIHRRYVAVVEGLLTFGRFTIDAPIGRDPRDRLRMAVVPAGRGKPAVTHIERLATGDAATAVQCRLETGRTHQIRVHLASRGHPLVGDALYGGRPRGDFARQALHAWRLDLAHPVSGLPLSFTSAVPPDLADLLERLDLPMPAIADAMTRPAA
jgi:23S rRNA pseudouridine1911/1915/1917 synthase